MLAIQKTKASHGLEATDVGAPVAGDGEVLVAVEAAGICGSDVHIFEWTSGYDWMQPFFPVTLGHEFAGRIIALGPDVTDLAVGQRVAVMPDASCGRCTPCRSGRRAQCTDRTGLGMRADGGFASLIAAPAESCLPLPDDVDTELGALIEPLAVGARAVEIGAVAAGENVVVLGAGMIGLSIALMAQIEGANVAIFGLNDPDRLRTARELGFEHSFDLAEVELGTSVDRAFGRRVDRVFEATGVPESVIDGLAILKRGGVLVATGIHARPLQVDLTALVRNRHQIRGSHAWTRDTWREVVALMSEWGEVFRKLITHRLPLPDALEGFALARSKVAVKVILQPGLA